MKTSLRLSLLSIKNGIKNCFFNYLSLTIVFLFLLTIVFLSNNMHTALIHSLNEKKSGTYIIIDKPLNEIELERYSFINEAIEAPKTSFISGKLSINNIDYDINARFYTCNNISSFFSNVAKAEYEMLTDEPLLLYGRMPTANNEAIINIGFLDSNNINVEDFLYGHIGIYHNYYHEKIIDYEQLIIVGIYSNDFLRISMYEGLGKETNIFVLSSNETYDTSFLFCDIDKSDKAFQTISNDYTLEKVFLNKKVSNAIKEFENLIHFLNRVFILIAFIILFIYLNYFSNYLSFFLKSKKDYIVNLKLYGTQYKDIILSLIIEFIIMSIASFVTSYCVSLFATNLLTHFISNVTKIKVEDSLFSFNTLSTYFIVLLISVGVIVISCKTCKLKDNI